MNSKEDLREKAMRYLEDPEFDVCMVRLNRDPLGKQELIVTGVLLLKREPEVETHCHRAASNPYAWRK